MRAVLLAILFVFLSVPAAVAQQFETVGSRALGMGGAFVAVADDPSAAWWNPAGLATGPIFGLDIEINRFEQARETGFGLPHPGDRSSFLLSATSLPLGLSYARTSDTWIVQGPADEALERTLTTHQIGATVVQSLTDSVVVAATLKYVRGSLDGDGSNAFDTDVGLLATAGPLKAGVTVRNAFSPEFENGSGVRVELPWRARAGVSYAVSPALLMAADVDLRAIDEGAGKTRSLAAGAEWRGSARFALRAGARIDTIGDSRPLGTVGGSYAVRNGMWVDVWAAHGAETANRGWGVAGRILY